MENFPLRNWRHRKCGSIFIMFLVWINSECRTSPINLVYVCVCGSEGGLFDWLVFAHRLIFPRLLTLFSACRFVLLKENYKKYYFNYNGIRYYYSYLNLLPTWSLSTSLALENGFPWARVPISEIFSLIALCERWIVNGYRANIIASQ